MSQLIVIRHGQASFFADDYDRLTSEGHEQSRCLGQYLRRKLQEPITQVYSGPTRRHQQTFTSLKEGYTAEGGALPDAQIANGLDEYAASDVMRFMLPKLREADSGFAADYVKYKNCSDELEKKQRFKPLYRRIVTPWATENRDLPGVETWLQFKERVTTTMKKIMDATPRQGTSLLITSAGTIGAIAGIALELKTKSALKISWEAFNCGVSTFEAQDGDLTLVSLNHIHFLPKPDLKTIW